MKRLVFTNLLIDQIWGKDTILDRAFQISNPDSDRLSRLNENLSIYLFGEDQMKENFHILSLKPDDFWQSTFSQIKSLKNLKYVIFETQPRCVNSWLTEFNEKIGASKWDDYVFSGLSELEKGILKKTQGHISNFNFPFAKLNQKDFLKSFCEKNNISFPESEIISGKDISFLDFEEQENFFFKSLNSSGGAGLLDSTKLKTIQTWIERNGLTEDWNRSFWLKQEILHRKEDLTTFGHTNSAHAEIVKVHYDQKLLSDRHSFNPSIQKQTENMIQDCFQKIRKMLLDHEYNGYFGFDSILSADGKFFPVTDLNIRMTKTHLLAAAINFWKPAFSKNTILRIRFINSELKKFSEFWPLVTAELNLNAEGLGAQFQIIPLDVSGWSFGRAEATWIISSNSENIIEDTRKCMEKYLTNFIGDLSA